MKLDQFKELQQIGKQWERDFKGDLFEDLKEIMEVYQGIENYIDYLINECFEIWIEENPDMIEVYQIYKERLKDWRSCKAS